MPQRVRRKWRPPLWFVLAGPLGAVCLLPLLGLGWLRWSNAAPDWTGAAWLVGAVALAAALVLGLLLWRLVLRPVRGLTAYAHAVARGGGADAPAHYGTPEFSDLGQSVIEMGRVLQGRAQVVRSYADHVTHEMTSPLSAIAGAAELLEAPDLAEQDRARLLANIGAATERMRRLLEEQRRYARAADPAAAGAVRLSEAVTPAPDVQIVADGIVPLPREVLALVLEHLIGNARAVGAGQIRLDRARDSLSVTDDGPGVSDGNRDRIFDPFFTTRRGAGGTGMGLAIVRRMLEAQGAEIALAPEPGPGARFVISW